jgi:hypothetical protein
MLIADGNDLNPKMAVRWQVYIDKSKKKHHPVFAPWNAFAALPENQFALRAPALAVALAQRASPEQRVNPLLARALAAQPPKTLGDVARIYGKVLNDVDKKWQALLKTSPSVTALPDHDEEELRHVLYAPDSPPMVRMPPLGDLALLPDRASQAVLQKLLKSLEEWRTSGPGAPPRAMSLVDTTEPYQPRVFLRGNPFNRGDSVPRQYLALLSGPERKPFANGSGRLELARAIVDPRNPLTARVFVNRVWRHHFGAGLVRTPSDFGLRSDPPSHPELLDWLTTRFVSDGWSIKQLHRRILLSATYRQSSDDRPDGRRLDPDNVLLWKMNRRRLDFEATRDALLVVSGGLDHAIGGPSVQELASTAATRRTLYNHLDRLNLPGLYRTFDFPSPAATNPQRDQTTVAPQALFLMNHPFVLTCAQRLVQRTDLAATIALPIKVDRLYRLLYGREPTNEEVALVANYLASPGANWERCVQALLLANEFVFVD